MTTDIRPLIEQLMGANNEQRSSAERLMKDSRQNQAEQLLQGFVQFIVQTGNDPDPIRQNEASMAALLLKKQYLDDRVEEETFWQLSNQHVIDLKNTISASINFEVQTKLLLERKADIICKCFRKLENYEEMI
jgi:hypothetical protein